MLFVAKLDIFISNKSYSSLRLILFCLNSNNKPKSLSKRFVQVVYCQLIPWNLYKIVKILSLRIYSFREIAWQGYLGSTNGEGTFWAKWPKTAWKLQNQHFWVKTVGGGVWGEQANFLGSAPFPFSPSLNSRNPALLTGCLQIFLKKILLNFA